MTASNEVPLQASGDQAFVFGVLVDVGANVRAPWLDLLSPGPGVIERVPGKLRRDAVTLDGPGNVGARTSTTLPGLRMYWRMARYSPTGSSYWPAASLSVMGRSGGT